MKLLFINQSLGIGGAETFNKGLLLWLQKHGTTIKTYVANKTFQKDLVLNNVPSQHIPIIIDIIGNRKGFIKGIVLLPSACVYYTLLILRNRDTDIILMSGFIEKILVTPIAKLLKKKIIWVEFAPLDSILKKFFGIPKFLYKLVILLPDKIIVPSEHTLSSLAKYFKQVNFILIPCARDIDPNNYSNIKCARNSVCCVSRLEKGKGQDLLLKAWQTVEKYVPYAKLNIVGEGSFFKELSTLCSELNLNNVSFKGFVQDSLEEIAKSEISVFPTVWPLEGFGLSAVEAMALAKPVIGFNFGPVPEIVDKNTGILVKPNDTNALANAILKLLKSPVSRKKLGQAGRKKYLNNFTFDKIGPKYLEVFESI